MAVSGSANAMTIRFLRVLAFCFVIAIGCALLAYIFYYMFVWSPSPLVREKPLTSIQQAAFVNERLKNAVQLLGGLFFVVTAFFTYRTVRATERTAEIAQERLEDDRKKVEDDKRTNEDRQISERFAKATENLDSSKNLSTRLGAVHSLEAIARESPKDHRIVFEVLSAFLRETAKTPKGDPATHNVKNFLQNPELFPYADLIAALDAIGRRCVENDDGRRILLMHTVLPCIGFAGGTAVPCFEDVNFTSAYLRGSVANGCNFARAVFSLADLTDIHFSSSDLTATVFLHSTLVRARFSDSNLTDTDFRKANVTEADFRGVDLTTTIGLTQEQVNVAIGDKGGKRNETSSWAKLPRSLGRGRL